VFQYIVVDFEMEYVREYLKYLLHFPGESIIIRAAPKGMGGIGLIFHEGRGRAVDSKMTG